MSLRRRLELIDWAKRNEAWIVEDDYDSEFRYSGRPLASLQGLDPHGRVVYIGTFSKVLMPSLRIGYVVAPPALVDVFTHAKAHADWSCPQFEQSVLADFLVEGHFARHIRRMRALYQERQGLLVQAARQRLGGLLDVRAESAGMHLAGWLPPDLEDQRASRAAVEAGVDAAPLSTYALEPYPRGALLLGYAAFGERDLTSGVEKLARALEKARRNG
jgi:GntR family transcriptional regulator/MocR family aminotransferase